MHEYTLIEQVVEEIIRQIPEKARPGEVLKGVSLDVGALEMHSESSFRQAFALLSANTPLETCELTIRVDRAMIECPECLHSGEFTGDDEDVHSLSPYTECPDCGKLIPVLGGKGINKIELIFGQE
jgi:Zn finger protein HypA/HybF involved in hydrogenase expression